MTATVRPDRSVNVTENTGGPEHSGPDRGHRTLAIARKGGKAVTIPLTPRTARATDLPIGERSARTGSAFRTYG
jgi:hypothetical protein